MKPSLEQLIGEAARSGRLAGLTLWPSGARWQAGTTEARLSQPTLEQQQGSDRVPGKTNGKMKAVRFGGNKYGDDESELTRTKSGNEWAGATGANKRSVWTVTTKPFKEAHFATFPPDLIEPCILAGCPEGGTVLDPFFGAGTTGLVAKRHNRNAIGIELNPDYIAIAKRRLGLTDASAMTPDILG